MRLPTTVLLIDDDPQIVDVTAKRLRTVGYEVLIATDGVRAFDLALVEKPDVILLGANMQRGGGNQVARKLREHPETIPIPVILISAAATEADYNRAFLAGIAKYLTKPCDPIELIYAIDELVERYQELEAT